MAIIQNHLVIRTFYQYFIKRLFNFFILKFIISIFVILFLSSKLAFGAKSTLNEVYCGSNNFPIFADKIRSISYRDKEFNDIVSEIDESLLDKKYNLIVSLGSRPSGGYKLEFNKIKNKSNKIYVYFNEIKPKKNSQSIAVITYPFCLVKIENLNEYKVKIKKKRSKFFPFSIFH